MIRWAFAVLFARSEIIIRTLLLTLWIHGKMRKARSGEVLRYI